jgi:hypothetical protein
LIAVEPILTVTFSRTVDSSKLGCRLKGGEGRPSLL